MRVSSLAKPSLMFAMAGIAIPAHAATTLSVNYTASSGAGTPITIGNAASPQFTFLSTNAGTVAAPIIKDFIQANGSATVSFPGRSLPTSSLPAVNGPYDITFDIGTTPYFGDLVVDDGGDHISRIVFTPLAGSVPEPASWAMMLLGLGAAGAAVRSRRQAGDRTAIA